MTSAEELLCVVADEPCSDLITASMTSAEKLSCIVVDKPGSDLGIASLQAEIENNLHADRTTVCFEP